MEQLGLFDESKIDWSSKDVYYVAISSMQKAIRRGDAEYAKWVVGNLLAVKANRWPLQTRLITVAIEDVGVANLDLIADYLLHCRTASNEEMADFAARMASSPSKSREACDLLVLADNKWVEIEDRFRYVAESVLVDEVRSDDLEQAASAVHVLASRNKDKLIELYRDEFPVAASVAEITSLAQREGMWRFLPFLASKLSNLDVAVDEADQFAQAQRIGPFLSCGIDWHTSSGKTCISSFVKRGKFVIPELDDPEKVKEDFGMLLFAIEGQRVNKRLHIAKTGTKSVTWEAMRSMLHCKPSVERYKELCAYVEGILPDFNGMRTWLMEKKGML